MDKQICPPIIIIGMHRSGTTMITRMLETMGLFVGNKKDSHNESLFFLKLNDWMLRQSSGRWDYPQPIKLLLKNTGVRVLVRDYLKLILESPRLSAYLGWRNYFRYRSPFQFDFPWGWKDPRNSFTLSIWMDIFPNAKVVHVYRHGVDVANSLLVRQQRAFQQYQNRYQKLRRLRQVYWLRPKRAGFTDSLRTATLEGGFSLWEEYMQECRSYVEGLGDKAMEVKFEDFLSKPLEILECLAKFCELEPSKQALVEASRQVRLERAYAYRANEELCTFAQNAHARSKFYGY